MLLNALSKSLTEPDCTLRGRRVMVSSWPDLSSAQLQEIVGDQHPSEIIEHATDYRWQFIWLPTSALESAGHDGQAPDEGWAQVWKNQVGSDLMAVEEGSPEYAGRQEWLRDVWAPNSAIYPLYVVREAEGFRLLDGFHRLAAAFHMNIPRVATLLGTPPGTASTPHVRLSWIRADLSAWGEAATALGWTWRKTWDYRDGTVNPDGLWFFLNGPDGLLYEGEDEAEAEAAATKDLKERMAGRIF